MGKRVVYIYTVLDETYKEKYPGINKKVYAQVKEFNRSGLETTLNVVKYEKKSRRFLPFQSSSINWMSLDVWKNFDGLYLRYSTSDYQMIRWLKRIKMERPDFKVVIEIPTYPYEKELCARNRIIVDRDRKYREQLRCWVDRLVINGKDNEVFGIPTILTANGVDLDEIRIRKPQDSGKGEINLCFVAAFAMWHGADRVIEGLKEYYNSGGKRNIQIHMVGSGDDTIMIPLKKAAENPLVKNHLKFYGFLNGEELSNIYDISQVAIGSLGLHRLDIEAPSTLKSREYLARGIPFIYSSTVADFEQNPVDFALQIKTDDSPVDFFEVIRFYDGLMEKYKTEELTKRIRDYADRYVSIRKTMAPIVDFIKG